MVINSFTTTNFPKPKDNQSLDRLDILTCIHVYRVKNKGISEIKKSKNNYKISHIDIRMRIPPSPGISEYTPVGSNRPHSFFPFQMKKYQHCFGMPARHQFFLLLLFF